jgi:protein-S-isoprenylcysteine O-methyltransferase Ste14
MTSPAKITTATTAATSTNDNATHWHQLLPPKLVLLLVVAMIATRWSPLPSVIAWPRTLLGLPVLLSGVFINLTNAVRFGREQTNIVTFEDPTLLLTDGWFARTRNPMYLGFALILAGVAVFVGSLAAWLGPVAFIAVSNWWYIPFEERRLTATFGESYVAYAAKVRRWL